MLSSIAKGWKGRQYEIIYVDFPWWYTQCGTAKVPYNMMSWEEIARFPWHYFMAERCVIFFWTTGPHIMKQMLTASVWCDRHSLVHQGIPYRWIKTKQDGTPIKAAGPRPRLVKPLGEDVHALTNVKRGRTFPLLTESQVQSVFAPKPRRGEHSTKPDEVADRIVELLGDRPRVELFGRKHRPGWDVIGDESPHITRNLRF